MLNSGILAPQTKVNVHKLPYIKIKNAVLTSTPSSQESTTTTTNILEEDDNIEEVTDQMAPKPYDDLFIEPAGDYDVVYGDYNST